MYKPYIETLKKVHDLAKLRKINKNNVNGSDDEIVDLFDFGNDEDSNELLDFLISKDLDTLKIIQTAMYLGRDYSPETPEEAEERMLYNSENPFDEKTAPHLQSDAPERLFNDWFKMGFNDGADIRILADHINSKSPLDDYLQRSFIILNI